MTYGQVLAAAASVPAATGTTSGLALASASVPVVLTLTCADQVGVEPFSTVTLTVTASDAVTTWGFTSAGITFAGTAGVRTFVAPGAILGVTVPIVVTADAGTLTVHVSVLPHGEFRLSGGPIAIPVSTP